MDINVFETIIDNINDKNKDWLKIEDYITQGVNSLMNEIKDKIISDFYESSINNKLSITDIINAIFKKDYNHIFSPNSAFTRALSQSIDDLIKNNKLYLDFYKFDKIKNIIFQISEECDSIDDIIESFKSFKIELNNDIYKHIKIYIDHYINNEFSNNLETSHINYSQFLKYLIKN